MRGSRSFFNAYKSITTLVAKVGKIKERRLKLREKERDDIHQGRFDLKDNIIYQINRDGEIRTRNHLVIKILIPCQRIIST